MKEIPENAVDVKEILYKQLGLLAEASAKGVKSLNPSELCSYTSSMCEIANVLAMLASETKPVVTLTIDGKEICNVNASDITLDTWKYGRISLQNLVKKERI